MIDPFLLAETYYDENEKYFDNVEPAWAKAAHFFRTRNRFGHHEGSSRGASIPEMKQTLDVFKKRAENGDTLALLHAVSYCAEENMPLPAWLALNFNKKFRQFLRSGGPTSLDEAFPSKEIEMSKGVFLKGIHRSGKRAMTSRRDHETGKKMWWDILQIKEDHPSLDSALNAVLEKGNYGLEKTKARELVLMIDKIQQEFLGKQKYPGLMTYFARKKK